jgi:hypothetical protein
VNITPEEAAQALREIDSSRLAMRAAVRAHRGHLHLWLWGSIWIIIALISWREDPRVFIVTQWISGAGAVGSFLIGFIQGRQVRSTIDRRFIAVSIAVLAFGYVAWPALLGYPHTYRTGFAYGLLVWMQVYVIAGIWFDNYWVWMGLIVTALVLAGLLFFPALFWGCVLLAGATLLGTGFYVRYFWR